VRLRGDGEEGESMICYAEKKFVSKYGTMFSRFCEKQEGHKGQHRSGLISWD
jgi:hypothetical protein